MTNKNRCVIISYLESIHLHASLIHHVDAHLMKCDDTNWILRRQVCSLGRTLKLDPQSRTVTTDPTHCGVAR